MNTKWLLDARIRDGRVLLAVYDENSGEVSEIPTDIFFYGYIISSEPENTARELSSIDSVENVWIEKWYKPPYYVDTVDIVVYRTRDYRVLRGVVKTSLEKGLKVVNTYPHPLVEALYRAGLRPLTTVRRVKKSGVELNEWNHADRDPHIDYIVISVENSYFTVETSSERVLFYNVDSVVDFILSRKYLLGFTDPHLYVRLLDIDSRIRNAVYTWVTGGVHHPSEYYEWCRLSYTPLGLMNNTTIGRVLSTIETLRARDRKYIVFRRHGRREQWRTMRELLINDRGGVVYQPKPGLYWRVCQIDFKSLYPSIIVKYNVSGETINKNNCSSLLELPWSSHRVCLDSKGIVPESIEELIALKDSYDKLYRDSRSSLYEFRRNAVKWILVASFGYLGYRNSLFGSVMAHELVTSTSRELMRRARIVVEKLGYRTIHAIVDSLFITRVDSVDECLFIRDEIVRETGFEAKVEAHYTWLYVPRSLVSNRGVANKYYGLLSSNQAKIKGIMCIRSDTPLLVKKAQREALDELFKARSPGEFLDRLSSAHRVVDKYVEKLVNKDFDVSELVICRYSRVRSTYIKPPFYAYRAKPPYRLIYVEGRLVPFEEYSSRVDVSKYIELLERARRELPETSDVLNTHC